MKINEILTEGPFWSGLARKAVGAAAALGHKPSQDAKAFLARQPQAAPAAAPTTVEPVPAAPIAMPVATTAPSWVGKDTNIPAVLRKQQAQQKPVAAAPAAAPTAQAVVTPIAVPKGSVLTVIDPRNKGKYYKNEVGQWTDGLNRLISKPASISRLEQLADAGAGSIGPKSVGKSKGGRRAA